MYKIKLENFEGPLDLLLFFVRKDELNIYDIPIAHITKSYLEYLKVMQELNLDIASEFILMAATLMRIKVRCMLPPEPGEENEEEPLDPREELTRRLIEYRQFKEASKKLSDLDDQWRMIYRRNFFDTDRIPPSEEAIGLKNISFFDLLAAYKKAVSKTSEVVFHNVERLNVTVEEQILYITDFFDKRKGALFTELCEGMCKIEIVVTFLALLDLIRREIVFVRQSSVFDDIWIQNDKPDDEKDEAQVTEPAETDPIAGSGDSSVAITEDDFTEDEYGMQAQDCQVPDEAGLTDNEFIVHATENDSENPSAELIPDEQADISVLTDQLDTPPDPVAEDISPFDSGKPLVETGEDEPVPSNQISGYSGDRDAWIDAVQETLDEKNFPAENPLLPELADDTPSEHIVPALAVVQDQVEEVKQNEIDQESAKDEIDEPPTAVHNPVTGTFAGQNSEIENTGTETVAVTGKEEDMGLIQSGTEPENGSGIQDDSEIMSEERMQDYSEIVTGHPELQPASDGFMREETHTADDMLRETVIQVPRTEDIREKEEAIMVPEENLSEVTIPPKESVSTDPPEHENAVQQEHITENPAAKIQDHKEEVKPEEQNEEPAAQCAIESSLSDTKKELVSSSDAKDPEMQRITDKPETEIPAGPEPSEHRQSVIRKIFSKVFSFVRKIFGR